MREKVIRVVIDFKSKKIDLKDCFIKIEQIITEEIQNTLKDVYEYLDEE